MPRRHDRSEAWLGSLLGGLLALAPSCAAAQEPVEPPDEEPVEEPAEEPEAPSESSLTPPRIVHSEPPTYPTERLGEGLHPEVVVVVVIDDAGDVIEVEVPHEGDPDFDAAARAAVERWRFEPARRGEVPIPSRVRVAVHFDLPGFNLAEESATPVPQVADPDNIPHEESRHDDTLRSRPPQGSPPGPQADEPADAVGEEFGVEVRVDRPDDRAEDRSAADFRVRSDVLSAAPRQEGAEVLRTAPGLYIARVGGDAVGHRIILRGFDAEHGQDIALSVGGLPINLPSHIHGQGYADLGFVISEVVDHLAVSEGVYDPAQGDFAVAGSVDLRLGVRDRGWRLAASYGSFNTFRALGMWAPHGEARETFGAVQVRRTDGFGQRRRSDSGSAIVQLSLGGDGPWRFRGLAILHGARGDTAGVVRQGDIDAGRVDFYGAYDFPTARAQNAMSGRVLIGVGGDYRAESGANGRVGVWAGFDGFRLQRNFTGFDERSRTLAGVSGRGDLIEQNNETFSVGVQARYRTEAYRPFEWARGTLELGLEGRVDLIEQQQNLIDATTRNQTWDRRVDASIRAMDLGLYGDLDWTLADIVGLRLGARGDLLSYAVDDRLGNFVPSVRPHDAFIVGFRRSALGFAAGPRASVDVRPAEWLSLRAAYGEGYRSPQARTLEDGEQAPFTKVWSGDLGVRARWDELLTVSLGGFYTELSDDVTFDAASGRLERVGASRRVGATLYVEARPLSWLRGAFSATYVNAELLEPPPATAEDPQPPFVPGQSLPFVPPVVLRADVGANGPLVDNVLGLPLRGRLGVGFTYLAPRPLPFGAFAPDFALMDASGGISLGPVELGVEAFNLFDVRYSAMVFNFASTWRPSAPRSRVPALHNAAGAPFTILGTVRVTL